MSSASPRPTPRVRPPALRDGRGQQEALQARPRGAPARLPRRTASCPRACSTTWPCSAGRSPTTATSSPSRRWSRRSTSRDVNPNPARFDLKKAEAINAAHMRLLSLEEIDRPGRCRSSRRPGVVADPVTDAERRAARAGDAAGPRADQQAHRGARHARLPVRRRGRSTTRPTSRSCSTTTGSRVVAAARDAPRRRSTTGRPRPSRRRCAPRWSRSSGSSRATPSGRSGSPSPAAGSRRRSSSRSSCSAARSRWPGSTPLRPRRAGLTS